MSDIVKMRDSAVGLRDIAQQTAEKAGRKIVMIEIGSYQGESMEMFVGSGSVDTIVCIDPWKNGYDSNDIASSSDMVEVESMFDKRADNARKTTNVIKHKGTIDTFLQSEEFKQIECKVDLVYIDGCHTYESCKHDIEICQKFIQPRVAFAGHDYVGQWSGVIDAVDESLGKPDQIFSEYSWIKFI